MTAGNPQDCDEVFPAAPTKPLPRRAPSPLQQFIEGSGGEAGSHPHRAQHRMFDRGREVPCEPDETDVVPNPMDALEQAFYKPPPLTKTQKRNLQQQDSTPTVQNDTGSGHRPLQVENDIADLGTLLSLMQPRDIAKAQNLGHA